MKSLKTYTLIFLTFTIFMGCKKDGNYPGATVSPFIAAFDLRDLYKGTEVALTTQALYGSSKITGMVISDHSGGNLPAGLLILQDSRRLGQLRGIAVAIGAEAANYVPGDSVVVEIAGGVLNRSNGMLQITGVPSSAVTKISSGNTVPIIRVPSSMILADPERFESTSVVIVKAGFNPLPTATDVLAGDKLINDGFGDLTLHTEASAKFANNPPPFLGNFYGIVFTTLVGKDLVPQLRMRTADDAVVLSSVITEAPIIISGFISDVSGADGNHEYIQLIATRDINFVTTPFSVVVTNNANASTPTGNPANGWATGGLRTYKMNLTSGIVTKGSLFYVGGATKLINGVSSTSISQANWIKSFNYTTTDGDGFGTKTGGLLANSGNASGIAVFGGTTVTAASIPVDVMFVGSNGSIYTATPNPIGYRITNTDWYDTRNPITLEDQPFYRSGSNTLNMSYTTSDIGYFYKLGGEYNVKLGRWMKARTQTNVLLTKQSTLAEIEGEGVTKLLQ